MLLAAASPPPPERALLGERCGPWNVARHVSTGHEGAQSRQLIPTAATATFTPVHICRPAGGSTATTGTTRAGSSFSRAGASAVAAGLARRWCHEYDLGKPAGSEVVEGSRLECVACSGGVTPLCEAAAAATTFVHGFQQAGPIPVPPRSPEGIGRLVVQSLGSPAWLPGSPHPAPSTEQQEADMLALVLSIRQALQDSMCAALVTCPTGMAPTLPALACCAPGLRCCRGCKMWRPLISRGGLWPPPLRAGSYSPSFEARLQHLADTVLCLQSLADDSELYQLLPDPMR